jgi:hypothetical protein
MDAVLERRQKMPPATKHVRLETGFPVERDEPVLHRALPRYELLDDADARVRDVADPREKEPETERRHRGPEQELEWMSENPADHDVPPGCAEW